MAAKSSQLTTVEAEASGKQIHQHKKHISSKVRFMSSNLASVISVTACFPLEVLKTRIQIQGQMEKSHYGLLSLKKVLHEEGHRGLYRGYTVSVFCIPLFHTLYFPLYERTKEYFQEKQGWHEDSFKLYSVSAGISGLFCNIVTNPFWVVRTRMQAEIFRNACNDHYHRTYQGIFHSMNKIAHEEGVRALFNGLTASILGISHALIYFPLYEHGKIYFKHRFEDPQSDKLSSRYVFLSAIISKFVSSAITYPHEVLRARQQDSRIHDKRSTRLRDIIREAVKREGPFALYSGFTTNLMRILPHYAIVFVLYEHLSYKLSELVD